LGGLMKFYNEQYKKIYPTDIVRKRRENEAKPCNPPGFFCKPKVT